MDYVSLAEHRLFAHLFIPGIYGPGRVYGSPFMSPRHCADPDLRVCPIIPPEKEKCMLLPGQELCLPCSGM